MKQIIINEGNREVINNTIREAEGRATARTINFDDCMAAVKRIDAQLDLPQRAKNGIIADVDIHAQSFAGSYKGTPMSTQIRVIYKGGTWRLMSVRRANTQSPANTYQVYLTDIAKEELMKRRIAKCTCFC